MVVAIYENSTVDQSNSAIHDQEAEGKDSHSGLESCLVSSYDAETLRPPLRLQLTQQLLDAIFFLECGQAVFDVVDSDVGLGLADRFLAHHFMLHAIKHSGFRAIADVDLGVAG